MAFFFGDSFDLYTAITDCGTYWDAVFGATVTLGLSPTGRFAGSRGIVSTSSNNTPYISKTSGSNDAVHHISVAYQQSSALSGATAPMFFTLFDGATAQCTVYFRSDGAIVLASGAVTGTALATYTGAIAAINTWYQFEIEVVVNNATGSIAVRKNGNTSNDFFLGSLNTRASANNYANKISVGVGSGAGIGNIIDDFLWRSDAASVPWVGDIRCYTRMPATDSSKQWSNTGTTPRIPFPSGSAISNNANLARYTAFTPDVSGSIASVVMQVSTAGTANFKCAIYASDGTAKAPGTALGSATPIGSTVSGGNTFSFGTPVAVTAGTLYYVAIVPDASSGTFPGGASQSSCYTWSSATYASFPTNNPPVTAPPQSPYNMTVNITPAYNAGFVAEPQQDAASSYVYSSTNGQSDLYTIGSIASTPTTIIGVTTRGYYQKSDAGTRNATVQLQSGATNVQGTSTALPAGSWQWIARNDLVDPATGAAWTATGVNNVTIGPVVTA